MFKSDIYYDDEWCAGIKWLCNKKNQCKKMMDDKIIGDQTHAETIHSTKKWVHVTLQNHLEIVLLNTQLIVRPGM